MILEATKILITQLFVKATQWRNEKAWAGSQGCGVLQTRSWESSNSIQWCHSWETEIRSRGVELEKVRIIGTANFSTPANFHTLLVKINLIFCLQVLGWRSQGNVRITSTTPGTSKCWGQKVCWKTFNFQQFKGCFQKFLLQHFVF